MMNTGTTPKGLSGRKPAKKRNKTMGPKTPEKVMTRERKRVHKPKKGY